MGHDEETTAKERDMEFEQAPHKAEAYKAKQDETRDKLSRMEDEILKAVMALDGGSNDRWLVIGMTHIQQGFMAIKRGLYEGKRVGDP